MISRGSVFGSHARVVLRVAMILALAALAALALSGALDSAQSGVLTMLPALALAVMMFTRPYLGEGVIARLRARGARPGDAVRQTSGLRRPQVGVARGGRLIAMALAGRAPPPALAGCR